MSFCPHHFVQNTSRASFKNTIHTEHHLDINKQIEIKFLSAQEFVLRTSRYSEYMYGVMDYKSQTDTCQKVN